MFVQFKTTENRPVAINPVYVVFVTPGQERGTTQIELATHTVLTVIGEYLQVLERLNLGSETEENDEDEF